MVYWFVFRSFFLRKEASESAQRLPDRLRGQEIFFYRSHRQYRLLRTGRIERQKNAKGKIVALPFRIHVISNPTVFIDRCGLVKNFK